MTPTTMNPKSTPVDEILSKLPSKLANKLYAQDIIFLEGLNMDILNGAFDVNLFVGVYKNIHQKQSIFPDTFSAVRTAALLLDD